MPINKSLCNILPEALEQKVNDEPAFAGAGPREAENICGAEHPFGTERVDANKQSVPKIGKTTPTQLSAVVPNLQKRTHRSEEVRKAIEIGCPGR
jgi:hypothetical protein